MKKSFLLVLLLLPGAGLLKAQDYHPLIDTGKQWSTYHQYCGWTALSDYVRCEGDTVIGARTYNHAWSYYNESMTQKRLEGFIREDVALKKVFLRYTPFTDEFLLYDFGAAVGDTLLLHDNPYPYILDTIDTFTLLSGEQRRSFRLSSTYNYPCFETWVEGIGSISKGMLNSGSCGFTGDDPVMLCAWENDTMKYHNPGYSSCFILTSAGELNSEKPVRVYPNPAISRICIEIPESAVGPLSFELLDARGVAVIKKDVDSREKPVTLDMSAVPPGVYLYLLTSGKEILANGKLTVL